MNKSELAALFARHKKVALYFGGGKDSLACLYLLRPHWDRLHVYWCNPGNPFPETIEQMQRIRKLVPLFKEVRGNQPEIIAQDGWPSDVVPERYTTDGNIAFGPTPFKVQHRLYCCYRAFWMPMFETLLADGMTCLIRSRRHGETDKTEYGSGTITPQGQEIVFPIFNWTADDVYRYLQAEGVELPPFYRYSDHSIDCMDCTGYWGEGHGKYLAAQHPKAFIDYHRRITLIKRAVAEQMDICGE